MSKEKKYWIPLESNPELFTELIHNLGVSKEIAFHDVLSLNEPELLALVPRPALALVLVVPCNGNYTERIVEEERDVPAHDRWGDKEEVMFYTQTIGNACGWFAILHALSNGDARSYIGTGTHMAKIVEFCENLTQKERIAALEQDADLATKYKAVSVRGDSAPPEPEIEADYAYMCFVKSNKNGHLYQLEGCRKGPIDLGPLGPGEDVLSDAPLRIIKDFGKLESGDIGFNLMALTRNT
ncbi:ubiquitin C-terminal hydrolase L3 [Xylariaceae sp. FL0016]|nr:ubiquitin C-terminal hydrolase L3 [Xylariaceae sp. FL0016]